MDKHAVRQSLGEAILLQTGSTRKQIKGEQNKQVKTILNYLRQDPMGELDILVRDECNIKTTANKYVPHNK